MAELAQAGGAFNFGAKMLQSRFRLLRTGNPRRQVIKQNIMSLLSIFKISSEGMTAQRERLEAASANLANANSTRTSTGKAYQRRDVVFTAQDVNEKMAERIFRKKSV